jgi:hypothetical protein
MGACLSVKNNIINYQQRRQEQVMMYKPLFTLKKELLEALNMDDEHFFSVFCTFRFRGSVRADPDFVTTL